MYNGGGVYRITNKVNGKSYVGSTNNFKKRKSSHWYRLRKQKHGNPHLQRAWDKYGEDNFEFAILEIVEDEDLLYTKEEEWMERLNVYDRDYGYNISNVPNSRREFPEEIRRKMSGRNKGKYYGGRGSEHPNSKLNESDIIEICNKVKSGRSPKSVAEEYNTEYTVVYGILKNESWTHVKRDIVEWNDFDKVLTEEDVIDIKMEIHRGISCAELARRHGVDHGTILHIRNKKAWTHVLPDLEFDYEFNQRGFVSKRKKLNVHQVVEIKKYLEMGYSAKEIAEYFNVATTTIYAIKNKESWKDINI